MCITLLHVCLHHSLVSLLSSSLLLFLTSNLVLLVVAGLLVPAIRSLVMVAATWFKHFLGTAQQYLWSCLPAPMSDHLGNVAADVSGLGFGFACSTQQCLSDPIIILK